MEKVSAGLLMYRLCDGVQEFFLVHPGGPFFRKKDTGWWTIPKGVPEPGEELLDAAQREFLEETGIRPRAPFKELGSVKQKGGKVVYAWAFQGEWDPSLGIKCNNFTIEWPPRSGKKVEFPEVDQAKWFDFDGAAKMIIPEQVPLIERALHLATL